MKHNVLQIRHWFFAMLLTGFAPLLLHGQATFSLKVYTNYVYATDGNGGRMPDGYGSNFEGVWRMYAGLKSFPGSNFNTNAFPSPDEPPHAATIFQNEVLHEEPNGTFIRWKNFPSEEVFSYSMTTPGNGETINLSNATNLTVRMGFQAFESDGCSAEWRFDETCSSDKDDDNQSDHLFRDYPLTDFKALSNDSPSDNYKDLKTSDDMWGVSCYVSYKFNAINKKNDHPFDSFKHLADLEVGFFKGPGNTNFQNAQDFCNGGQIVYRVPMKNGYKGGYYKWEYQNANGTWTFDRYTTTEYLDITAGPSFKYYRAIPVFDCPSPYIYPTNTKDINLITMYLPTGQTYNILNAPTKDEIVITKTPQTICGNGTADLTVSVTNAVGEYKMYLYSGHRTDYTALNDIFAYSTSSVNNGAFTFTGIKEGDYTVAVRDKNWTKNLPDNALNCYGINQISISALPQPKITLAATQPKCSGQKGAITVTYNVAANAGVTSMTYVLKKNGIQIATVTKPAGSFNHFFTNLDLGDYTVTATNQLAGCSFTTLSTTINAAPNALNLALSVPPPVGGFHARCKDDVITITAIPSGGTEPYTLWLSANPNTKQNSPDPGVGIAFFYTASSSGPVEVTLEDNSGCTKTATIQINVPPSALVPSIVSVTPNTTCVGTGNGSIVASASGGAGVYRYSLDGVNYGPSGTFNNLPPGTYTIYVKDNAGCIKTIDQVVDQFASTLMLFHSEQNLSCFNATDGSIELSASGGDPFFGDPFDRYLYRLKKDGVPVGPPEFVAVNETLEFSGLEPGNYSAEVTDELGCVSVASIPITEPTNLKVTNVTQNGPICTDEVVQLRIDFTGRADGIPSNFNFQYSFDGGNYPGTDALDDGNVISFFTYPRNPQALNNLNTQIAIIDNNNCMSAPYNYSIINPAPLTASLTQVNNTSCTANSDGSMTLQVQGGVPPYVVVLGRYDQGSSAEDFAHTDTLINSNGTFTFTNLPTSIGAGLDNYEGGYSFIIADHGEEDLSGFVGCLKYFPVKNIEGDLAPLSLGTANPVEIDDALSTGDDINCSGANGQITVTATNGLPPYSYSLDNVVYQSSNVLIGASTSNTVYVKDKNGCSAAPVQVDIDQSAIAAYFDYTLEQESDCAPGAANIQIYDGVGPYTITLFDGFIPDCEVSSGWRTRITPNNEEARFSGLTAGDYTICLKDANSCQYTASFTITKPDPLQIVVTNRTNETCLGFNNGSFAVAVTGGYPPYTIQKNFGDDVLGNTAVYSGLSTGTYLFSVADAAGCLSFVDTVLTYTKRILLTNTSIPPLCPESPDGTITVAPYNGTAPYTCYWETDPANILTLQENESTSLSGLPVTEINFHITDADGCTETLLAVLQGPDYISAAFDITDASCGSVPNGMTTVLPTGGTAPYTYSLDGVNYQNSAQFNNLVAGNYTVHLTDFNGCTGTQTFSVGTSITLTANTVTTPATCSNSSNGTINITINNGQAPYQYSLDGANFVGSSLFSGIAPGSYTVYYSDAIGCLGSSDNVFISSPPAMTVSSFAPTPVTCPGGNNGALQMSLAGGTPPFQYSINGGASYQSSNVFQNLTAGSYILTARDANNCQQSFTGLTITEPPTLIATVTLTTIAACSLPTGSATVSAVGGTPGYTFIWDNLSYQNLPTLDNILPGPHEVKVTDAKGCVTTESFDMTQSPALSATLTAIPDTCGRENGALTVQISTGSAPYMFNWSNGTQSAVPSLGNLEAGSYSVTITDQFNCTAIQTAAIQEITGPTLSLQSVTDALCQDGTGQITVLASGGTAPLAYNWAHDPGLQGANADLLTGGTYTVTISDAYGCTATLVQDVAYISGPSSGPSTILDAACNQANGQIIAAFNGGTQPYNYVWSHAPLLNNPIATALPAGTYTVTVSDANNCTLTFMGTLANLSGPSLAAGSGASPSCGNANGLLSVLVNSGTAPYTYRWSHNAVLNSPSASNLLAGTYTVTVTDARNCTDTFTQTITEIGGPAIAAMQTTDAVCTDGTGAINVVLNPVGTAPFSYAWSHDNSQTNALVEDLYAGVYTVTVTDANNCSATQTGVISYLPGAQIAAITIQNSLCTDGNGTLTANITPGLAPFTLQWSHDGSITTNTVQNLTAGNYSLTVTDDNGCTDTETASVALEAAPVFQTPVVQNTSCGLAAGSVTTVISGGSPGFLYEWSNTINVTGPSQNGLAEGIYSVTVTDNNGCTDETSVDVINLPGPTVVLTSVQNANCNQAVGIIIVNASGLGALSYQWSHSNLVQTPDAQFLMPGAYTVTVTDMNGCTATISATVNNIPGVAAALTTTNSLCIDANGSIQANASGNATPFVYVWSHNALLTSASATGLSAGTYTVTVVDANGCSFTASAGIVLEAAPVADAQATSSACSSPTGTVSLQVSGGALPLVYTWSHDAGLNAPSAVNLPTNTYSVTVTDANGCTVTAAATVDPNPGPQSVTAVNTNAICGLQDGTVTVNVGSGTPPYTYAWAHDAGLSSNTAVNLGVGLYAVTITDMDGCTATVVQSVSNDGAPDLTLTAKTDANCSLPNGSAAVSATGGVLPYAFEWFNAAMPQSPFAQSVSAVNNLSAATYFAKVTDANGCVRFLSITIDDTPGFSLMATAQAVSCAGLDDGVANIVVANGGTGPFQYLWNNNNQTPNNSALGAGNYTVTVSDALGCTQTASVNITAPSPIQVIATSLTPPTCSGSNNGTVTVTASGGNGTGYSYDWPGGLVGATLGNLSPGIYTVTVIDLAGCTGTLSIPIQDPQPINLTFTVTPPTCSGQTNGLISTAVVGGNGGYQFNWSNGQTTPTALSLGAGTFILTVTDNKGCTTSSTVSVQSPQPVLVTVNQGVPACGGAATGQLIANASGGTGSLSYLWSDPFGQTDPTASTLSAGTYTVTVTDDNGCTSSTQSSIVTAPAVTAAIAQVNNVSCGGSNDGSATVNGSGGTGNFSYFWNDPAGQNSATATGLASGIYQVSVTDALGCSATASATIQAANDVVANIAGISGPTCDGLSNGTVNVFIPGNTAGFMFQWSDPVAQVTQNAQNLTPGNYTVTITNPDGCTKVLNAAVPTTAPVTIAVQQINGPLCAGQNNGTAQVLGGGGTGTLSYLWSDPLGQTTPVAFALSAGNYTVTVTDANGCTQSQFVNVPGTTPLMAQISGFTAPLCAGQTNGTASTTVSGGTGAYNWLWSNAQTAQTATNLISGTYTVTITDQNGCSTTATAAILSTPALSLSLVSTVSPACSGQSNGAITVNGSGGTGSLNFVWGTTPPQSGIIASNLPSGNYAVTLSDQNGCTTSSSYTISPTTAIVVVINSQQPLCANAPTGSITATPSGGTPVYSYLWNNGQTTETASNLAAGTYTVTISDQNGCTQTQNAVISATTPAINAAVFSSSSPGCAGGNDGAIALSASGGSGALNFTWSGGGSGSQRNNLLAGTYTVTINDAVGCSSTLDVTLNDGPVFVVELGAADTSVCGGDALLLTLPDNSVSYSWTGPNGFSAATGSVILENSGTYQVNANHPSGCSDNDIINVMIEQDPMAAFFVIATDVVLGDTIVAVEVSWPVPGNVEWQFDPSKVTLLGQDLNQYYFKFLQTGDVALQMRASTGSCIDYITKTIRVFATPAQLPPFEDRGELVQFIATPNPSTGVFNIIAEFEQSRNAVLSIFRPNGLLVDRRVLKDAAVYNQSFNLSGQSGIYSAILQIEGRKYSIAVVVVE
ncbi:MAG: beta strand repeat-containing protein [Saprospiraceae bacterium]